MNRNFNLSFKGKRLLDFDKLCKNVGVFRANFSKNSRLKNAKTPLFIEEAECFLVAFFGLLSLDKEPILLQKSENDILDKFEFDKIMSSKNAENSAFDINAINLNALFYIQTSGSSGTPKLVAKTLKQMLDEAEVIVSTFNINESDVFVSCVSNQHLYGLTFQVFTPLVAGARVEKQDFDFLNLFVNFNENDFIFIASPIMLKTLAKSDDLRAIKRAKKIFSAGGKLENSVREVMKPCEIIEIYGGSEMGVVAYNDGTGFVGFKGVDLKLDEQNRLIISSKWQRNFLNKTPFLSADLAKLNGDKLTLLGRFDRIVKIHAKRISLEGVEERLKSNEFIEDAVAFLEAEKTRLSALLVLNKKGKEHFLNYGKKGIVKALQAYLFEDFGAKIRYFKILSKLPYNAQGKLTSSTCVKAFKARNEPEFELIEKSENEVRLKAYISDDCFYFDGHFGDFPLTPGFVQVKFVLQNARKYLAVKDFVEIENVKFLAFLRPFQNCFLNLNLKGEKLYFELFANTLKCCSGRAKVSLILNEFKGENSKNLALNSNKSSHANDDKKGEK